jgi:hypothetical protein
MAKRQAEPFKARPPVDCQVCGQSIEELVVTSFRNKPFVDGKNYLRARTRDIPPDARS